MSVVSENPKYLVLLALAEGSNHGLGVQRQIIRDTTGGYLPQATIYDSLKALVKMGLAESYRQERLAVYEITDKGRRLLELAAKDRHQTSTLAQRRLGFASRRSARYE